MGSTEARRTSGPLVECSLLGAKCFARPAETLETFQPARRVCRVACGLKIACPPGRPCFGSFISQPLSPPLGVADRVLGRRARGLRGQRSPSCGEVFAATGWRLRESLSPGIQVSAPVRGERGPSGALTLLFGAHSSRNRRVFGGGEGGVGCLFLRSGRDRTASEGEWLLSGFHGAAKGRREALTTGKKECLSIRLPEAISHVGTGGSLSTGEGCGEDSLGPRPRAYP